MYSKAIRRTDIDSQTDSHRGLNRWNWRRFKYIFNKISKGMFPSVYLSAIIGNRNRNCSAITVKSEAQEENDGRWKA